MKKIYSLILILFCLLFIFTINGKSFATEEQIETDNSTTEKETSDSGQTETNNNEEETKQEQEQEETYQPQQEVESPTVYEEENESSYYEESQTYTSTDYSSHVVNLSLSSNNYLKKLTLDVEGINPEFDRSIDTYYIVVPLDVETIKVNAVAEDDEASIKIEGNTKLPEGESTITVTVTAEDNTKRYYKIKVTRTDDASTTNASLKELTIEGYEIEFESLKYKYSIDIPDDVSKLTINAVTENEKATFEIEGNENLTNGENKIVIRVTAEDGTTQKEYYIYAVKGFEEVEVEEENQIFKIAILIICAVIFLICFITLLVRSRKKF